MLCHCVVCLLSRVCVLLLVMSAAYGLGGLLQGRHARIFHFGESKNLFGSAERGFETELKTPWLRTNVVNTSGAAAKVMNSDRLGKKVRPGTFGKIEID